MLIWIVFWLSVALIPLSIWLHRWLPPLDWSNTSAANTSGSWLFGLVVMGVRLLLQLPLVIEIALRPLAAGVPRGIWLFLSLAVFVAVEAALGFLHTGWMNRATAADRRRRRTSIRILGPAYFLGLTLESAAIGWVLWAGGGTA
jgi:hypothetical protein